MILLPGREDARHLGLLRDRWRSRRSRWCAARSPRSPRRAGRCPLPRWRRRVDLSRSRLEMMLKVLDVDGAVRRVSGGWAATGQDWAYDAERYARVAAERSREQQAMLGYICDGRLPDGVPAPRARRPGGSAVRAVRQLHRAALAAARCRTAGAAAARDRLLRPGVEVEPRTMWPTGMKELGIDVAGKIGPDLSAEPGRALGRLTDLGWGPRLRALLLPAVPASSADPGSDGPIPDDLVAAVVKVLAAWDWAHRPAGVVTLPSRSRPQLIESLGQRMAEIGRMPYLGALTYADGARPGARQYNSAQRLRALWHDARGPRLRAQRSRKPRRPGAARRRPDRDWLDDDRRGQAASRGRCRRRPAARARSDFRLSAIRPAPPCRPAPRCTARSSPPIKR